jgi:hypothetical protein
LSSAQDAQLRELLDALRPGSDDLSRSEFAELVQRLQRDPQFKEVAARSQRLDQAISDAMHDLPIPAGAVDRLLARLEVQVRPGKPVSPRVAAAADLPPGGASTPPTTAVSTGSVSTGSGAKSPVSVSPSAADLPVAGADSSPAKAKPPEAPPRRRLRLRLVEVGVLALAASLAAVGYFFTGSPVAYDADQIVREAQQFATHDETADWQELPASAPAAPLAKFAFAAGSGLTVKPSRWREVHDLLARNGVAYELRSGAGRATLYVVERDPPSRFAPRFEDLPAAPPTTALTDSGNVALSAWAEGKLLYVLVVSGGPQHYKAFVAQPGPLASL